MPKIDPELAIAKTSEIIVALLAQRSVEPADLPELVRRVRAALEGNPTVEGNPAVEPSGHGSGAPVEAPPGSVSRSTPAVPIEESIKRDYIISLEDGKPYRSLRRHLMAKYKMTPDDYRRKWALPPDYPMVAPSYAEERSLVAKRSGLGKRPTAAGGGETIKLVTDVSSRGGKSTGRHKPQS